MTTPDEMKYKQEVLPKLLELREKMIELGFPFLFAVQVGEVIHQVGDTTGGDRRLTEAGFLLFGTE